LSIQSSQTLFSKEAIFIAVGINDSIQYRDGRFFMVGIEFENNLKKLIQQSRAFSKNIYIVGLTKVDENRTAPFAQSRTGKSFLNERILKFNKILKEVSFESGVNFIEMFDVIDEKEDMFDGLHVNTNGQQKMFDRIIENVHFL
jgi:lysophospholipase L1-like esterase